MDDRYEEILGKYDFMVRNRSRARGAVILETDDGLKILRETKTSAGRLGWENDVKTHLCSEGFDMIDSFCLNDEGNISTANSYGTRYVISRWFSGEECDLKKHEHVFIAARNLAKLHISFRGLKVNETVMCNAPEDISVIFEKHNAEMRHIRKFLRKRIDRNPFETGLLKVYDTFFSQAENAAGKLRGDTYKRLYDRVLDEHTIVHGSYTYHNIIMCTDVHEVATTVFDRCAYGMQLMDLYYFLRKVMEKNNWDAEYGMSILNGYESLKKLDDDEKTILKILLDYPEKFWKLASYYMNGKKTWVSEKNIEKLNAMCDQLECRRKFIDQIR